VKTIKALAAVLPAAVALLAGCSSPGVTQTAPATVTVTQISTATPAPSAAAPPSGPVESPSTPAVLRPCSDEDLDVSAGPLESADTQRRVVVSFTNTSSNPCTLTGFPGADLVTAAGGVLVHVERRPALAAHRVTLSPGQAATADVVAYAIDTANGNACPRIGTLVVTPPNDFQSHLLAANLPICSATVGSVD
jgi:Protein of unknown function (DUF4232)